MHVPFALPTLLLFCYVPRAFCGDQCFDINQVQVVIDPVGAEYLPCDSSASISNCCPKGWICLSNGLCKAYGDSDPNHGRTSLYTGLCTDPLWRNGTVCPKICNNNATLPKYVGDGVVGCGDGSFCCFGQGGYECCNNQFSLGVATYLNSVTGPSPKTLEFTIADPTTSSTTATASTSTNTSLRTSSASTLVPTQRTRPISSASIVRSAVAASSAPPSPTPKAGVHQHVAVGVGIGVAVGLVILGGCVYFLLRRSRKNRGQPAAVLYVDGKSEMDAGANRKRDDRNHEVVANRHPIELDGGSEL